MGSVLGQIFCTFYMSDLENKISISIRKPSMYLRYVNDSLILANDSNEINILQNIFQKKSVFNFIHEKNKNNNISFLDVLMDTHNNNNNFTTSNYKNPSNDNSCTVNFKSEHIFRYKKANIKNLISRAKLIPSFKTIFYIEIKSIKT